MSQGHISDTETEGPRPLADMNITIQSVTQLSNVLFGDTTDQEKVSFKVKELPFGNVPRSDSFRRPKTKCNLTQLKLLEQKESIGSTNRSIEVAALMDSGKGLTNRMQATQFSHGEEV